THARRPPWPPALPTIADQGAPAYEVLPFTGTVAPAPPPAAVVNRLNAAMNEGLRTPEMRDTITKLGAVTDPGTPEEFGAFIAAQLKKWTEVGKAANIKLD